MQEFLPVVKATLLEWAQLALGNPFFAAFLILATALLASIVGMIRSVPIKKRAAASEKARAELANQLSLTQQQAASLQESLVQRNQQISATVQALASGFDLGEQPLPAAGEDLASDALWQQHDRAVTLLANRLRAEQQAKAELQQSYQTESAKRLEQEAVIDSLQNTLAEKALQITGLEQQVAGILEKHTVQSARLAELEQQRLAWDDTKKQRQQLEEKLATAEAELSRLQKEAEARQGAESIPSPSQPEPLAETGSIQPGLRPEPVQAAAPIEAIPQPPAEEAPRNPVSLPAAAEPAGTPASPAVEEAAGPDQPQTIVLPEWDYQPEIPVSAKTEAQTAAAGKEEGGGFAGKLKGLFGRSGQAATANAVNISETPAAVARIEAAVESKSVAAPEPAQRGKIKSLLGLSRQEPVERAATSSETRADERAASDGDSAKSQMKKIKKLFGMAKG